MSVLHYRAFACALQRPPDALHVILSPHLSSLGFARNDNPGLRASVFVFDRLPGMRSLPVPRGYLVSPVRRGGVSADRVRNAWRPITMRVSDARFGPVRPSGASDFSASLEMTYLGSVRRLWVLTAYRVCGSFPCPVGTGFPRYDEEGCQPIVAGMRGGRYGRRRGVAVRHSAGECCKFRANAAIQRPRFLGFARNDMPVSRA